MAAVYQSSQIPAPLLAFNLPFLPLLAWPRGSRWLRRRAAQFIRQDSMTIEGEPTLWRRYALSWEKDWAAFFVNDQEVLRTRTRPFPPLGLVIWIDNQYAAWPPDGRIRYGTLPTLEDTWVEIKHLELS